MTQIYCNQLWRAPLSNELHPAIHHTKAAVLAGWPAGRVIAVALPALQPI
jgi:hypothetical protein